MKAIAAFEAFLFVSGGILALYSFSRPSSMSRAVLFTLFIAASALAAMVLSLHAVLTGVANAN